MSNVRLMVGFKGKSRFLLLKPPAHPAGRPADRSAAARRQHTLVWQVPGLPALVDCSVTRFSATPWGLSKQRDTWRLSISQYFSPPFGSWNASVPPLNLGHGRQMVPVFCRAAFPRSFFLRSSKNWRRCTPDLRHQAVVPNPTPAPI